MERQVALLRAVNLGSRNKLPMADLRRLMEGAGYEDVRTHLQSGNVVFAAGEEPDAAALRIERAIAEATGLSIRVLVRTREELADVVAHDPLREHVTNPSRSFVVFLEREPDEALVARLDAADFAPERFAVRGREVYSWLPDGIGNARLNHAFWERALKTAATARNWNTVTRLLELAGG